MSQLPAAQALREGHAANVSTRPSGDVPQSGTFEGRRIALPTSSGSAASGVPGRTVGKR